MLTAVKYEDLKENDTVVVNFSAPQRVYYYNIPPRLGTFNIFPDSLKWYCDEGKVKMEKELPAVTNYEDLREGDKILLEGTVGGNYMELCALNLAGPVQLRTLIEEGKVHLLSKAPEPIKHKPGTWLRGNYDDAVYYVSSEGLIHADSGNCYKDEKHEDFTEIPAPKITRVEPFIPGALMPYSELRAGDKIQVERIFGRDTNVTEGFVYEHRSEFGNMRTTSLNQNTLRNCCDNDQVTLLERIFGAG